MSLERLLKTAPARREPVLTSDHRSVTAKPPRPSQTTADGHRQSIRAWPGAGARGRSDAVNRSVVPGRCRVAANVTSATTPARKQARSRRAVWQAVHASERLPAAAEIHREVNF